MELDSLKIHESEHYTMTIKHEEFTVSDISLPSIGDYLLKCRRASPQLIALTHEIHRQTLYYIAV